MPRATGQNPGHDPATTPETAESPPAGWGWREYVAWLVAEHSTLAAVAWKLVEQGDGAEDVGSVERALRRLRERGQRDGGVWGRRLLRRFGVPRASAAHPDSNGNLRDKKPSVNLRVLRDSVVKSPPQRSPPR